jgi:hypothetical protein
VLFSFSTFFIFLNIFLILQCAHLISQVFQCFSPYSRSYTVRSSFSVFFIVSCHIPGPRLCISHFPLFSLFLPNSRAYPVSHFPSFSVFVALLQVILCICLIYHVFHFTHHIPRSKEYLSHFPCFSFFPAIFQVLQCAYLIFQVSQFFLPCFKS